MLHARFGKFLGLMVLSLMLVFGVSPQVSAQENVIELNSNIPGGDHGDKAIKFSLAWYVGTAKGRPRTIMLKGPLLSSPRTPYLEYVIKTSITIPKNITLVFQNGARIKTGANAYIVLFGAIQAGAYQIFDTASDTRLFGAVSEAPFEWWGAHSIKEKPDALADWSQFDSAPAIQAAVKSCFFLTGTAGAAYLVKAPIKLQTQSVIDGKWCTIYGAENIGVGPADAIFSVNGQQNITVRNISVKLDGASRFIYVFGSRDVKIDNVFLREDATAQSYTFVDIHNSYHCFLSNVTMNGGAPASDNGSVGILIRSDVASGGFPVVDNIGIDDTTIGHCWTGVLLDCDNASNNILLRNVSIVGQKPSAPGAYYGIRSTGIGRIDFVNLDGFHMESIPRGITFEGTAGFSMSVKCARFSDVTQVFNMYGSARDRLTLQMVDFRSSTRDSSYVFYHLDSSVKKLDDWAVDPQYTVGPAEGSGTIK
jgi:hypothetical protein